MDKRKKIKGISGWLIIPTISLVLTGAIYSLLAILYSFFLLLDGASSDLLSSLIFGGFAFFTIYTFILELKHKKRFINYVKIWLWVSVIVIFILSVMDGEYSGILGSIVGASIWTAYFNRSKRVENTFIK